MKKIIIILVLFLFPFVVSAGAYEGDYPNAYFGYGLQLYRNASQDDFYAYYNDAYAEDITQRLQILNNGSEFDYRLILMYYTIYAHGYNDGISGNSLNNSDIRYFELDICASTNSLKYWVTNGNAQDFATNSNPLYVVTNENCTLWNNSSDKPDNVVGPAYWEWLKDYDGYVIKVFLAQKKLPQGT